jgi:hypothetical protein
MECLFVPTVRSNNIGMLLISLAFRLVWYAAENTRTVRAVVFSHFFDRVPSDVISLQLCIPQVVGV